MPDLHVVAFRSIQNASTIFSDVCSAEHAENELITVALIGIFAVLLKPNQRKKL